MGVKIIPLEKNSTDIFNYCTKYIVRERTNDDLISEFSEGWRFPLIMTTLHPEKYSGFFNEVTFVYHNYSGKQISSIEITGTFMLLYETLPLKEIMYKGEPTGFYNLTILLPVGMGYRYRYLVNNVGELDMINPQRVFTRTGKEWSFFFTDYYNYSTLFEGWELTLLYRLVEQIIPFKGPEAQNFINRFYESLTRADKENMPVYRLDDSVGEVNYITNILAREERHRLTDYKICIRIIDKLLRLRNPYVNSWMVSGELITEFYDEMSTGKVNGWNYDAYQSPDFFLKLLRRHCITGAFSHPRHGGNVGAAGWNFLKEKYNIKDETGAVNGSYFNWDKAIEAPLGINIDYRG